MEEKKRKTTTSSAVKNRYNKKVYSSLGFQFKKELVQAFKEKCAEKGVTHAEVVKKAIEDFLNEP